jgi:Spy/CpxP family protein refolding chaperone
MTKILSSAIVAGLLLSVAAPVAMAAEPKTKAACEKAKMKWDEATKKCTK